MISIICRQLSGSCSLSPVALKSEARHMSKMFSCVFSTQSQTREQSPEIVSVLRLNMLQDNPGAVKKKRRIGRGIGSSKGKTSGRGHKGQKARSGGSIPLGFEGGQTKFYKLLPKRGFNNKRHEEPMVSINVGTIQDFIDMGRLNLSSDTSNESITHSNSSGIAPTDITKLRTLTLIDLVEAGICTKSSIKHGVKLLAKGKERLKTPFRLHVSRASEEAIRSVEKVGGQITTVHYNRLALRTLLRPEKFVILPKQARPPPKWQPYYTNWDKNRGYLSVQAQMRDLLQERRPDLQDAFSKALGELQQAQPTEEDNSEGNAKK